MDRRTAKELHVECSRYSPDWSTVERANMQILERRFASDLRNIEYENYTIFLQIRDWPSHPLQKLNRSGAEDLARSIKKFLVDQKPRIADQASTKFNLHDFPRYAPLAQTFQFLFLTKMEDPRAVNRLDDGTVQVGVIGHAATEMDGRLEQTIASKLRGSGNAADALLIYSEGPLFLYDVSKTNASLTKVAEAHNAQQSFAEIWFLAHYRTGDQKLYRVI